MSIFRLLALSLIILVAIPTGVYAHCEGKHSGNHPHCSDGGGGGGGGGGSDTNVPFAVAVTVISSSTACAATTELTLAPSVTIAIAKISEGVDKRKICMVPPASYSVDTVSAARRSWGPSGSHPWLLGGSEDPWLSVPAFRRVWLYRCSSDLSIVAGWRIGGRSPMSASGR